MTGLETAIARFRTHLGAACGTAAVERFDHHHESASEAACAEAAVFDLLCSRGLSPVAADDPSAGGVDLLCSFQGAPFAVEITSLGSDKIDARCVKPQGNTGGLMLDTSEFLALVRKRISSKGTHKQAKSSEAPRALVIVSAHAYTEVFMRVTAKELISGQVGRAWPVGPSGATGEDYTFTDFKNAAHLRWDSSRDVETFRPRDALILLGALNSQEIQLLGVQNPNPVSELPPGAFSFVPTTRSVEGIGESSLHFAWSSENHEPYCHRFEEMQ